MKIINSVSFIVDNIKKIFVSYMNENNMNMYKILEPWCKVKIINKDKMTDFLYILESNSYYELTAPEYVINNISNYLSGKYTSIRYPSKAIANKIITKKVINNEPRDIPFYELFDELSNNPSYSILNRFYYYSYFDMFKIEYATFEDVNIGYFDIEVTPNGGTAKFPSPDEAEHPIVALSIFIIGKTNVVHTIVNAEVAKSSINIEMSGRITDHEEFAELSNHYSVINETKYFIHIVDNEYDLISKFVKLCSKNVNILSGWNSVSFDFKYMYNRAKKIKHIEFIDFFFPNGTNEYTIEKSMRTKEDYDNLFWKNNEIETFEFNVLRIPNLDYNTLIKTALVNKKYPSYKLGYISSKIISPSVSKIKVNLEDMLSNIDLLIKYNIMDSILVGAIEQKMNLIRFLLDVRKVVGFFPLNKINSNVILQSYLSRIFLKEKPNLILDTSKKTKLNENILFNIYRRVNNEKI